MLISFARTTTYSVNPVFVCRFWRRSDPGWVVLGGRWSHRQNECYCRAWNLWWASCYIYAVCSSQRLIYTLFSPPFLSPFFPLFPPLLFSLSFLPSLSFLLFSLSFLPSLSSPPFLPLLPSLSSPPPLLCSPSLPLHTHIQNPSQVGVSLQVFHNLGQLPPTLQSVLKGYKDAIQHDIQNALDPATLMQTTDGGNIYTFTWHTPF